MTKEELQTICASIVAAGIRANPELYHIAKEAGETERADINRIIAIWAVTQVDFIQDQIERNERV